MIYNIPVTYQMWGLMKVEASDVEAAKELALAGGLPESPSYVDDSMEVDEEGIEIHNDNTN